MVTSAVVTGVIRSTMELGKAPFSSIHSASSGSFRAANAPTAVLATDPLPSMLSQLMIVKGARPRSRRSASAAQIRPKVVRGSVPGSRSCITSGSDASNSPVVCEMLYPPSVMVRDTIFVDSDAIFSITASGSSGANRYSTIDPMTRPWRVPSACLSASV